MTENPAANGVDPRVADAEAWWSTGITRIRPGEILVRGYPIEDLIGRVSIGDLLYCLVRGELPSPGLGKLLDALLVAGCDHGPHAPSIAAARMAATTGVPVNAAIATGINLLGNVHGGAGEQAMEMLYYMADQVRDGLDLEDAAAMGREVEARVGRFRFLPGFGHRFHPVDPRTHRLIQLCEDWEREQADSPPGRVSYVAIARALEAALKERKGRLIPLNVDGAQAIILCTLGFEPAAAKAFFCVSRSLGITAHVLEQMQRGERIKGPVPRTMAYAYTGPDKRPLPS